MNSIKPICLSAFTILVWRDVELKSKFQVFSQTVMHTPLNIKKAAQRK
jgi:hypothetical protein